MCCSSTPRQAIPAIDYGKYIEAKQYWQFIPDWVMLLFVFLYGAATLLDVVRALQAQRRLQRARDGEPLEGLTPGEARCWLCAEARNA